MVLLAFTDLSQSMFIIPFVSSPSLPTLSFSHINSPRSPNIFWTFRVIFTTHSSALTSSWYLTSSFLHPLTSLPLEKSGHISSAKFFLFFFFSLTPLRIKDFLRNKPHLTSSINFVPLSMTVTHKCFYNIHYFKDSLCVSLNLFAICYLKLRIMTYSSFYCDTNLIFWHCIIYQLLIVNYRMKNE